MTDSGITSLSSTPHEPWQNARVEVQIRVLCNIARTNMTASCLTGKLWAQSIFYATDIMNIQYRTEFKMYPHQKLFESLQDVSKCQTFGCMFEQSSVKIVKLMLDGNQSYTVDDQPWTTDLVMSYMLLIALCRHLQTPKM